MSKKIADLVVQVDTLYIYLPALMGMIIATNPNTALKQYYRGLCARRSQITTMWYIRLRASTSEVGAPWPSEVPEGSLFHLQQ